MNMDEDIIRHYLRNTYFINGTAYAGKSTMVAMLAERCGMVPCGENYHHETASRIATPEKYPSLCYFRTMKDWQEFVNRPPEEYERWILDTSREVVAFEIAELMHLSGVESRKVIVDTNIPVDVLHRIAGYRQVAFMLSPMSLSVDRFFDRTDPDKQFVLEQIRQSPDPDATLANFRACLTRLNSQEHYDEYARSGFFTLVREDAERDTREEVFQALVAHFGLTECKGAEP